MSVFKSAVPLLRLAHPSSRTTALSIHRHITKQLRSFSETRAQRVPQRAPRPSREQPPIPQNTPEIHKDFVDDDPRFRADGVHHSPALDLDQDAILDQLKHVRVRYLRPAIWAILVSSGIFVGLSYLEARSELNAQPASAVGWLPTPQWSIPRRTPPTPTEVVIIGANSGIHLSSFLVPRTWDTLWHLPIRNVNYTQFTSMFVHSGALHFFVNMYFLNNFMKPVGYSRLFEGSPYHTLSFFLSAGVLSGFAQHWSTLIPIQKRPIPEIFIRCGGASGALFGILGVFCMQYPHAGLGILFVPVHFEAQHVLPAIMLFDFIGMIRGYSFVNFGHAVSYQSTLP
jgi:rhomboid-like protein